MGDRKLLNSELGRLTPEGYASSAPSGLAVVLDNVRSALNVGSVFRTSDAFKVDLVYLCGITATPPSAEIHKSALGAEDVVPWEKCADSLDAVRVLKAAGFKVLAVEQTEKAVSLEDFSPVPLQRYALVFGNEVDGVRQDVVDECDGALVIPQWGTKHSLNISVAAGVALWQVRCKMFGLL